MYAYVSQENTWYFSYAGPLQLLLLYVHMIYSCFNSAYQNGTGSKKKVNNNHRTEFFSPSLQRS